MMGLGITEVAVLMLIGLAFIYPAWRRNRTTQSTRYDSVERKTESRLPRAITLAVIAGIAAEWAIFVLTTVFRRHRSTSFPSGGN